MTIPVTRSITAHALLFDMDGTLVDSHASIEAVWFAFADRHGVDRATVAEALPGRVASDIIVRVLGSGVDVEAELRWIRLQESRNEIAATAVPGSSEFLASVPAHRWAVVTSAPRAMMVRRLTEAGLDVPRVAVTAEDVRVGKPHPEGFLSAAAQLGFAIESCVAFEDSTSGMNAAANAGARCIAIGSEPGRNILRVSDFRSLRLADSGESLQGESLQGESLQIVTVPS